MKVILKVDPVVVDFSAATSTLLFLPFYCLGGWLSDKFDGFKVGCASVIISTLVILPAYKYIEIASLAPLSDPMNSQWLDARTLKIIAALTLVSASVAICYGNLIAFICDLFPHKIRGTMFAFIYSIITGVTGGVTHLYGTEHFRLYGEKYQSIYLTIGISAVCVVVSLLLKWRQGTADKHPSTS